MKANTKLKIHKFIKKYGKLIAIIFIILVVIFAIDRIIRYMKNINQKPTTSFTPNISVINSEKAPTKVQKTTEEFVDEFINYCRNAGYEKAYNLLSDECKECQFPTITSFVEYVQNKFVYMQRYVVQNYSVYNKKYIYNVKLFDDIMATGLTNTTYRFQEEKIIAYYDDNNKLVFNIGGFIDKEKVSSVQENEYLKVDIQEKITNYSYEIYNLKLTNRSDYTVVIQDGNVDEVEISLNLGQELRDNQLKGNIVLSPGETRDIQTYFYKFFDDGDTSKSIILNNIRVMENYSGKQENAQEEINNAIDKFSMELGLE